MIYKFKSFLSKINSNLNTEHVNCMILRLIIYSVMPSTKQWHWFLLQLGVRVIMPKDKGMPKDKEISPELSQVSFSKD